MNQLIHEHSILRYLPPIDKRQFLILDAVRFSGEIIDNSYSRLEHFLIDMASEEGGKRIPEAFQYAWNIVDHSQRMLNFLKLLRSESDHERVNEILERVKVFRNTFQHMDERIDESILDNDHPVFGKLKWCMSYEGGKAINCIAISGALLPPSNQYRVGGYSPTLLPTEIILESVNRQENIEFDISSFMVELKEVVKDLENKLYKTFDEHKVDLVDRSSTTDVLFRFINGEEN